MTDDRAAVLRETISTLERQLALRRQDWEKRIKPVATPAQNYELLEHQPEEMDRLEAEIEKYRDELETLTGSRH